jgi:hypothetical protein
MFEFYIKDFRKPLKGLKQKCDKIDFGFKETLTWKMQIKTTMRCHLTPVKMAIIQKRYQALVGM